MDSIVQHSTYIDAPPDTVYQAVATGEGLDSWFTTGSEVEPRTGGRIVFRWKNFGVDRVTTEDGGPVLEAVAGKTFIFQWNPAGPGQPTVVRFELTPFGSGTRVDVTESGFPSGEPGLKAALCVAVGWGEALTLLKYSLESPERYQHPCTWHLVQELQPASN